MTARALPRELVDRVALKNTEEAEVVNAPKVFDEEVQLLLLSEQLLIIDLVVVSSLFFVVHGSVLAFFHVLQILHLLGASEGVRWRL